MPPRPPRPAHPRPSAVSSQYEAPKKDPEVSQSPGHAPLTAALGILSVVALHAPVAAVPLLCVAVFVVYPADQPLAEAALSRHGVALPNEV